MRRSLLLPAMLLGAAGAEEQPSWNWHAQATGVAQGHGDIRSPYDGENSLDPEAEIKATGTATLFLGVRLWRGAAIYVNPEVAVGFGLSDTLGIAGFPNGEGPRSDVSAHPTGVA